MKEEYRFQSIFPLMMNDICVLTAMKELKVRYSCCRHMSERVLIENDFEPKPEWISELSMAAWKDLKECCEPEDILEDV